MRDHTKLKAFQLADALVLAVYQYTKTFPREEMFGLTSQIRRAAISVANLPTSSLQSQASSLLQGCARNSQSDYLRFLDIAYGSAREVDYEISIAHRLGFLSKVSYEKVASQTDEICRVLNGLIGSLRS